MFPSPQCPPSTSLFTQKILNPFRPLLLGVPAFPHRRKPRQEGPKQAMRCPRHTTDAAA